MTAITARHVEKNGKVILLVTIAFVIAVFIQFFVSPASRLRAAITDLGSDCGGGDLSTGIFVGPMTEAQSCSECKIVCEIIGGANNGYLLDTRSDLCGCGQPQQPLSNEPGTCTDADSCGGTFYHTECNNGQCIAVPGREPNNCLADTDCTVITPPPTVCETDTECADDNSCTTERCIGNDQNNVKVSAIDNLSGFAYFGANTNPGEIAKVRLSDFTRVAALVLPEASIGALLIDPGNGYLYAATGRVGTTMPDPSKIYKIDLGTFKIVDSLTLAAGENDIQSGAIDTAAGFAYFGTNNNPGVIIKVRLSDLTRTAAVSSITGASFFTTAVIDPLDASDSSSGYVYFGTDESPGRIVKVRLSPLQVVVSYQLNSGESRLQASAIDRENNFAYFVTRYSGANNNSTVIRMELSPALSRVSGFTLVNAPYVNSAVISPNGTRLYLGTDETPGTVVKLRVLPTFDQEVTTTLNTGDDHLRTAVIDGSGTYSYFGTYTIPAKVVRIQNSTGTRAGSVNFSATAGQKVGTCVSTVRSGTHLECRSSICLAVANTASICTNQNGCTAQGNSCSSTGVCPKSICPFDAATRYTDGYFPYFGGTDNDIYDYFFGSERITNPDAEAYTSRSCNNDSRGGVTRGVLHMRALHSSTKRIDVAYDSDLSSTFKRFMTDVLNDSRGWKQAGVTFNIEPQGYPAGSTDLWVERGVANKAGARGGRSDSCSSDATEFPHGDADYFRMETGGGCIYSYNNCTRWLINHEVGHALGLTDRENKTESGLDKLMNHLTFSGAGSDKEVWPSAGDINLVRQASNCNGRDCIR